MAFKVWDWKESGRDILVGKLTAKLTKVPPWNKRVYGFELDNGEVWHIWGTTVLVGLLATLGFMTKVRIKYLGKGIENENDKFPKLLFDMDILELPTRTRKAERIAKSLNNIKTSPRGK
ncbi:MAG: hypothetical protein ACHQVK_00075 [Candidatus Paceibacterales bacterium]